MVAPIVAAKAYAAIQSAIGPEIAGSTAATAGPSFGQLVNTAVNDAVAASRNAEAQMTAQVQGKASLIDVVTAISSAETSLQTVLAVRDQVIASYQQIMNMSI